MTFQKNETAPRIQKVVKRDVTGYALVAFIAVLLAYLFLSPTVYYKAGNFFFGGSPALYNATFARYFFTYASYPIIGSPAPYAHHQLARAYLVEKKFEQALSEAENELREYPDHTRTFYVLGLAHGYQGDEREAIDALAKFVEAYPGTWIGRNDMAWLQFRAGDTRGALMTIEPVISKTENPWIQNTYGTLLLNSGRYDEAKIAFKRAQDAMFNMTENEWRGTLAGYDPRIYETDIGMIESSIETNMKKIESI